MIASAVGLDQSVSCVPRPPISLTVSPQANYRLQVVVAAESNPGSAGNRLQALRFDASDTALVDIPNGVQGATGIFTVELAPSTTQASFWVRPVRAHAAATVSLVVVDLCGDWRTFVGAGPAGFFTFTPTANATATVPATATPSATITPTPSVGIGATFTGSPTPTASTSATSVPSVTATSTSTPAATITTAPLVTSTATNTLMPLSSPTPTSSRTPAPTPTGTAMSTATSEVPPTATVTATSSSTPSPTPTGTATPTATSDVPLTATVTSTPVPRLEALVTRAVTGDSLDTHILGQRTAVGYLGVATPFPSQRCGGEALARNQELAGDRVLVEADPYYDVDALGRRLYYAFTPDERLIDLILVQEGLGRAVRADGRYGAVLAAADADAQMSGTGCLWAPLPPASVAGDQPPTSHPPFGAAP
jgi:endonuclease YncB( thermonuclease family)